MILVFGKVSNLYYFSVWQWASLIVSPVASLTSSFSLPPSVFHVFAHRFLLDCLRIEKCWKSLNCFFFKKMLLRIWQWIQTDFKLFHFGWGGLNLGVKSNLALRSLSQLFLEKTSCTAVALKQKRAFVSIMMLVTLLYDSLSDCGDACSLVCLPFSETLLCRSVGKE